jgi:hypothetical protein
MFAVTSATVSVASAQVPDIRVRPDQYQSTPERFATATTLAKTIPFAGIRDRKTTLRGALETLARRYDLSIDIEERAFGLEGVKDVLKTEVATVPIPDMKRTSLDVVLRTILARIPVSSRATYLIQSDGAIQISTRLRVAELYRQFLLEDLPWRSELWWQQIKWSVQTKELDLRLVADPVNDTGIVLAALAECRRAMIDRVGPARSEARP